MASERTKKRRRFPDALGLLLFSLLLPLIVVVIALYLILYVPYGIFLYLSVWCRWCARGRNVLFVYSDSPIWHDYIEEHILPRFRERAVVLNWSQRSQWKHTLDALAFRYFGGSREFVPLAIVFCPFRLARTFRFYEPFREFKHGKTEAVTKLEGDLFDLLDKVVKAKNECASA